MSVSLRPFARKGAVATTLCPEAILPRDDAPAATSERRVHAASDDSAFELGIADTQELLFSAFRLVYDVYIRCRLTHPNPYAMRVTPYHLSPDTDVFVASRSQCVACTMSLVRDGAMGLPMEDAYACEVRRRRAGGRTLAEVSCLAGETDALSGMRRLAIRLMGFMAQYAWRSGVDELLIAVHPDHAGFYERLIAFRPIGGERSYTPVCNKPAVAMALDLRRAALDYPKLYRRFFKKLYPERMFEHRPLSQATLDEMGRIAEASTLQEPAWAASMAAAPA
jgi:hypothetical protein